MNSKNSVSTDCSRFSLPKDMKLRVQTSKISIHNFQINSYHIPRERKRERKILIGVNGPIFHKRYILIDVEKI